MKKEFLGANSRFKRPPSENLINGAFAYELEATPYLFKGLSYADLAHVAALYKGKIISESTFKELASKLIDFHDTPYQEVEMDPYVGDTYNNRDETLKAALGDLAGYIHIGRARREASTVAWQLHVRQEVIEVTKALVTLIEGFMSICKRHAKTYMSDYTYLQHAQPTTLEHYLLGFAMPLSRDLARLKSALTFVNQSPAGSGSVNGSQLPIDREYLAELLGFDGLIEHTRDAMWAPDMVLDLMQPVISIMTTLDRLSEEFIIWSSSEFNYLDLSDCTSRTSVIMPHKKNPYGLAYIRGQARSLTGIYMSLINTNQTISGQPDNRIFSYYEVPRALEHTKTCILLFNEVLTQSRFNIENLAQAAEHGFTYSTDICDFIVLDTKLDNRTVHKVVGKAVATCIDRGQDRLTLDDIEQAAKSLNISLPPISEQKFLANTQAQHIVENRQGIGSANPSAIDSMYQGLNSALKDVELTIEKTSLATFENDFINRIKELCND